MPIVVQKFKPNDPKEDQIINAIKPTILLIGSNMDEFFNDVHTSPFLGDAIYDAGADPLVGVISKEVYRASFSQIHNIFTRPGTFDYYVDVFRAIFGDNVSIVFDVPSPGVLYINIEAQTTQKNIFIARRIVNNAYEYDRVMLSDASGYLLFQMPQGLRTQNDIDTLINEIAPNGIYVKANLSIIGA